MPKAKQIRDVMTAEPLTVGPGTKLREVAEILSSGHISGVPVVTITGRLVGVVSASDIVDFLASTPGVPTYQVQRSDFGELDLAADAMDDEESPASYFTDYWTDAGADVTARFDEIEGPEWNVLEEYSAEDIMTRRVIAMSSDAKVGAAARLMLDNSVHRILVVDDGKLVGIVTTRDLISLLAD